MSSAQSRQASWKCGRGRRPISAEIASPSDGHRCARTGLDGAESGAEAPRPRPGSAYDAGNLGMEMQPAPRNDDASAVYAVAAWPTYTPPLADGDGKALVQSFCGICHSTTYITMQPRDGRYGRPANPRGHQQSSDVWLPPGVGYGEPCLPNALQPQAHSPRDAAARPDAGAPRPPSSRPSAPRADSAADLESALVFGCLFDSLLEWRSRVRRVRDRLSRSRGPRVRRVAAPPDWRRHPHVDGPHAVGALRSRHA